MRCPRCRDDEKQVEHVATGKAKLDYILACWACPWQVAARDFALWIKKWTKG